MDCLDLQRIKVIGVRYKPVGCLEYHMGQVNTCGFIIPQHIRFRRKITFLEAYLNNFPIWFTRCHFDFDPITSIFYIEASWGGGLRPPVFDLENQCRGGSAELYKGGYLTILEPPPFLFSSRVYLSRHVFCANDCLDKNCIFPWFEPVCSDFAFFWPAMLVQQDINFQFKPSM